MEGSEEEVDELLGAIERYKILEYLTYRQLLKNGQLHGISRYSC
jgi:hypothetical protein